ncbi:MAG: urea ABC transporter permease subunit UrtC [Verrucomicrobia bacterium]|nr:urea ABC transporter permease subunit UrtC [Verrucomicrobiota bacterium]
MLAGMRKREWGVLAAAMLIATVVLPLLNAYLPAEHPLHVSDFSINLYGKYLTYAVLAIGIDLLWGYTGLLSLGQGLFFGLGGYAMGMYLVLMIGTRGQYHNVLPDYMVFLEYKELPAHFKPFYSFPFAVAAAVWVPALVALIFGFLAFRSRVKGVYFSILSQALTYGAALLFFRNDFTFGGNNGFTDFKDMLGFDVNSAATRRALYVATCILLAGAYVFGRWITATRFGKIQRAIRDSENRVRFSGYNTVNFKLFIFVVAAIMAGLAGALYVPQVGIINPSEMTPDKSLEAVVWVAVGGRGTLYGPILGAVGVNALKSWVTRAFPEYWLFFLGGMFVTVVLLLPGGLVSLPRELARCAGRLRQWGAAKADARKLQAPPAAQPVAEPDADTRPEDAR